jgi:myo-inositol-1(or 4)-monophosphatase
MGSLALDLAWTAAGRFDAFFYECALRPWDYAAGAVICTEVGLRLFHVPETPDLMGALIAVPPGWEGVLGVFLEDQGPIAGLPD